jgi:ABC-type transporter Mla subunit MlaD
MIKNFDTWLESTEDVVDELNKKLDNSFDNIDSSNELDGFSFDTNDTFDDIVSDENKNDSENNTESFDDINEESLEEGFF